jgi:hypothetical protein
MPQVGVHRTHNALPRLLWQPELPEHPAFSIWMAGGFFHACRGLGCLRELVFAGLSDQQGL